jgi:predicted RNase H-like nuclease (RuvC/YqgF family)
MKEKLSKLKEKNSALKTKRKKMERMISTVKVETEEMKVNIEAEKARQQSSNYEERLLTAQRRIAMVTRNLATGRASIQNLIPMLMAITSSVNPNGDRVQVLLDMALVILGRFNEVANVREFRLFWKRRSEGLCSKGEIFRFPG